MAADLSLHSVVVVLASVTLIFSTNPLLTTNSEQVGKQLGLVNRADQAKYIEDMLTLVYYLSGVVMSPVVGYLLGFYSPKKLLALLLSLSAVSCNLTAFINTSETNRGLGELICTRAMAGMAVGGMLPVVYAMVRA
jgi:MFS family permease